MIDVILMCLALNIYFEARGELMEGQFAVAEVTMRRADLSGRAVCQEVFEDHQFSWTLEERPIVRNKHAWQKALSIAAVALERKTNFSKGATHFHNHKVRPKWASKLCRTITLGKHTFYKECNK